MGNEDKETVLGKMFDALPENFAQFSESNKQALYETARLVNNEVEIENVTFFYDKSHYKHYI